MKRFIGRNLLFISLFSIFSAFNAGSENFKVRKLVPVRISNAHETVSADSGLNDGLFISLPEDRTFISGIEISLTLPEEIASKKDFLQYSLYENIRQNPTERRTDYTGEKLSEDSIPPVFTQKIYIPLTEEFDIKDSPYSLKIPSIPNTDKNFIFFRLKQKDDQKSEIKAFEKSQIQVSVKPVLINKGILSLELSSITSKPDDISIYIDDKKEVFSKRIMLPTGEHRLSVVSNKFRNEVRTFRIEQGKISDLSILLRGIEPTIQIICPETATLFLDNKPIKNDRLEFPITQGEHIIKFVIGDYDMIKSISAEKGRSYIVNLTMDATIQEN